MGSTVVQAKNHVLILCLLLIFTMSNTLDLFEKDEFDYIVIDECHHATAQTYKKIIQYFEPEFLLDLRQRQNV